MNKATFERALKAAATGKPMNTIEFRDLNSGRTYEITGVIFDNVSNRITILGIQEKSEALV